MIRHNTFCFVPLSNISNVGHFRIQHGQRVFFKLLGMARLQNMNIDVRLSAWIRWTNMGSKCPTYLRRVFMKAWKNMCNELINNWIFRAKVPSSQHPDTAIVMWVFVALVPVGLSKVAADLPRDTSLKSPSKNLTAEKLHEQPPAVPLNVFLILDTFRHKI